MTAMLNEVEVTGTSLGERFTVHETQTTFDGETILGLLRGGSAQSCAAYIIRNAVPDELCRRFSENFWEVIGKNGGNRSDDELVAVAQIGATQFTKSSADYIKQVRQAARDIEALFAGFSEAEREVVLRRKMFSALLQREEIQFGPAQYSGTPVGLCTARSWVNIHKLSLEPHEDQAQLAVAKREGFEIGQVQQVVTANACMANGEGGEFVLWDVAPDEEMRANLGVTDTGYPYPLEMLTGIPQLEITLNQGDFILVNSNLLHAVKSVHGERRITVGRFMGLRSDSKAVYWT